MKFNTDVQKIFDIFENSGFEIRLIGGCVRDTLLGTKPKDWDFATNAKPYEILKVLDTHQVRHIEPGLSHGTVSAIIDDDMYEITTLRVDVSTDGRHAEVAFTSDWAADAERRDFTINAMSMDSQSKLHDYFHGFDDIADHKLVFVGGTQKRIDEDYLRILRMFRFAARGFSINNEDLKIAVQCVGKMYNTVSVERIYSELKKTFETCMEKQDVSVIHKMIECEIFKMKGLVMDVNRLSHCVAGIGETPWSCLVETDADVERMAEDLKMDMETRKYTQNCVYMRKFTGSIYHCLLLIYNMNVPVDHVKRYFGMKEIPVIKIDAVPLMQQGFVGSQLGHKIVMERNKIIESFWFQ